MVKKYRISKKRVRNKERKIINKEWNGDQIKKKKNIRQLYMCVNYAEG